MCRQARRRRPSRAPTFTPRAPTPCANSAEIRKSRPDYGLIRQSRPDSGTYKTVTAKFWHIQDSHGTRKTVTGRVWQARRHRCAPTPCANSAHTRQSRPDSGLITSRPESGTRKTVTGIQASHGQSLVHIRQSQSDSGTYKTVAGHTSQSRAECGRPGAIAALRRRAQTRHIQDSHGQILAL